MKLKFKKQAYQTAAVKQPARQIVHEIEGCAAVTRPHDVGNHQLGVWVQSGPGPHVALAGRPVCLRFLFAAHEAPDFIRLDALAVQAADVLIVVVPADFAHIHEQLGDGILAHAHHAAGSPDGAALDKASDDRGSLFRG